MGPRPEPGKDLRGRTYQSSPQEVGRRHGRQTCLGNLGPHPSKDDLEQDAGELRWARGCAGLSSGSPGSKSQRRRLVNDEKDQGGQKRRNAEKAAGAFPGIACTQPVLGAGREQGSLSPTSAPLSPAHHLWIASFRQERMIPP